MLNKIHIFVNRFGMSSKYFDKAKLRENNAYYKQEVLEGLIKDPYAFRQGAAELCEKALVNAKAQLHPLLQQVDLEKLGQRREFVQAFKQALERAVAEKIVLWLPSVKVVYKFDSPGETSPEYWDNTVHLLLRVSRLLPSINELGAILDNEVR